MIIVQSSQSNPSCYQVFVEDWSTVLSYCVTVCIVKYNRYCFCWFSFMVTSGMDRRVKIWDLRTYKCMHQFKVEGGASSLHLSTKGLLAA